MAESLRRRKDAYRHAGEHFCESKKISLACLKPSGISVSPLSLRENPGEGPGAHRYRFFGGRNGASPSPSASRLRHLQDQYGRRERVPNGRVRGQAEGRGPANAQQILPNGMPGLVGSGRFSASALGTPPSPGLRPPSPSAHTDLASACNRRRRERGSFTASTKNLHLEAPRQSCTARPYPLANWLFARS